MVKPRLSPLFAPRSVAIVGASPRSQYSRVLSENLAQFPGPVWYVNPRHEEVGGKACFPSVAALPQVPDHVLIITPSEAAVRVAREAAEAGVGAMTLYASGFAESRRTEGKALDAELREIVGRGDIALCGPNCMGVASTERMLLAYTAPLLGRVREGPVSVISHSGGLLVHWLPAVCERGLGIRHAVSSGNEIGATTPDYLEYFVDDPGTRLIVLLYLEAVGDGLRFVAALRRALAAGKPVLAVKVGRSETARAGSLTHTGRLSPSNAEFDAAARSCGVTTFATADEVPEAILAFLTRPSPAGGRAAVIAASGALANHMTDLLAEARGELSAATLTGATLEAIDAVAPGWLSPGNPLDGGWPGQSSPDSYLRLCSLMVGDPNVDLLLVEGSQDTVGGSRSRLRDEDGLRSLRAAGKPIYFYSRTMYTPTAEAVERARSLDLPYLQGTGRAVGAVGAVLDWQRRRGRQPGAAPPAKPWSWPGAVRHDELVAAFQSYGVPVAPGAAVASAAEAADAAERLGWPVALKRLDFAHKTEHGGVRIGLADRERLAEAYGALASIPGDAVVYVQKMAGGEWPLLFGGRASPFGPLVVVGMGGVFAEYLADVNTRLAPVGADESLEMLRELRGWRYLERDRQGRRADVAWLAEALSRFSLLVADGCRAGYTAVEANPVLVGPQGTGGAAVDLRAELSGGV